jgi:tyrosine aminotransferase
MSDWLIFPSDHSERTRNSVLESVTQITAPSDFPKPVYSLAIGDPSKFPDFEVPSFVRDSVNERLLQNTGNGYTDSIGSLESRQSLAKEFSYENIQLSPEDVVIDIGGVGAIHTMLQVFLNPGDNILIPSPGFALFQTIAWNLNAEALFYDLNPRAGWEVDFASLDSKVNERSKLLVIVNPSNPCGSVFSKEHLLDILAWAERHKIPILADEVYHGMTFGKPHHPLGSLTESVPVFTVGALSKMFLVPGWRCGWILIYDKQNRCSSFRPAFRKIKNMLLHPTPFIMQAIPEIFRRKPANYFEEMMEKVKARAELVKSFVQQIEGLNVSESEGSLYVMISVDLNLLKFKDSFAFCEKFAKDQGVILLPAEAFLSHSGFRVVLCNPLDVLEECMKRLKEFVEAILKKNN